MLSCRLCIGTIENIRERIVTETEKWDKRSETRFRNL